MSEYLLSVMGTVLFCALLTAILPEGKTTNTVKGITKVACLLVIISPILIFLNDFTKGEENSSVFFDKKGIETDDSFIKYYQELKVNAAEDTLESEIKNKFNVDTNITLFWSVINESETEEKIKIDKIQVKLPSKTGGEMKDSILVFLKNNYCSEVLIE